MVEGLGGLQYLSKHDDIMCSSAAAVAFIAAACSKLKP